jgi:hypothetical protein
MRIIDYYAKAFEDWENDYRTNPQEYLTAEQALELGVSELSAQRASYFYQLMQEFE